MSAAHPSGREIARGLVDALRPAFVPGAPNRARAVARDVAQVMGLDGLDAVLAEFEGLQGVARPADLEHVAARVARLSDQADREESPAAFLCADGELAELARALRETEWSGTGVAAVAVYAAPDVLADLPLEPNPDLPRARLSAPVAASLRAALEWIGADEALLVQAAVHDSALTLSCPAAHAGGIGPAGAVLASVEGSIGPEADGRWTLRVPLHVERPSFLLLRIGHIPVALPWHSVARLRMLSPGEWARLPEPVLEPLTTLQPGDEERPGALVALGLARAWLVADRVVWRIATLPEEVSDHGPFAASTRVVSVENGERYWVLETAWLLRGVVPTPVAPPAPRPRHGHVPSAPAEPVVASAPDLGAVIAVTPDERAEDTGGDETSAQPGRGSNPLADAAAQAIENLRTERPGGTAAAPAPSSREMPRPEGRAPSSSSQMPRPVASAPPSSREMPRPEASAPARVSHAHLTVLRQADVVPRGEEPRAATAPSHEPMQASPSPIWPPPPAFSPALAPAAAPEGEALPGRRALVADDSLVARIFLARLLERRGYVVDLVGDGESMWRLLTRGPWALVCADVTMPDSHGRAHLERLLDFRAACREPFKLIALTRDAVEEQEAALAGAMLHLRKPFDPGALDDMLDR